MDNNLNYIKTTVFENCLFSISNFELEAESSAYDACRFELNSLKIISRSAKITPKKSGLFVTLWKRNVKNGLIEPFEDSDEIDFFLVTVRTETEFGQFVFPKSTLIKNGIISTIKKEGKRAFRVYPPWSQANNKQAEKTQKWQQAFFYKINDSTDFVWVTKLFELK